MNIKQILGNKTTKNASWLIFGKVAQMVLSLFIGLLTSRYLGPSNVGLIHYGAAYTAFFVSLCNLGINSVLVKEFIDNPNEEGKILGTSILLKAIASVLSVILIFCIVFVIDGDETQTVIIVFLCSLGVLFNVFDTLNYWFQSRLESKISAIATLIGYIATSIYRVVLLINGCGVTYFALATSVDYLVIGIVLLVNYKKHNGGHFIFSSEYAKKLLSKSWHFIIPGLMVSIYAQTDKLMLKQMIDETEIGYYSTAVTICGMWCFILNAIIDSFYPSIMELHKSGNHDKYKKRNRQLYCIVFYVSVFFSLGIMIFSRPIVLLLYGKAFEPTSLPLRIITWYTAFSYLGVARNAWIVCEDKQKYIIYIYISSAIINILLNTILIPTYKASGAATASLITQIITCMVVPLFIRPLRENTKLMAEAIIFKDCF